MCICIEAVELTKNFGARTVVDRLSFNVRKGEAFGLLGHNGAGKSTTIDLLLGLKKPDSGRGRIFGMEAAENRKDVFERVGVQLQSSNYQNNIRVDEVCRQMASLYRNPYDYRELLNIFSLED
ncbi:MAG: ATP-binding cassette domain-containing protein, partial [Bacillota bacterium]|nr:ATP-binding cassette domain-containing protein [Bacillota bacterium]